MKRQILSIIIFVAVLSVLTNLPMAAQPAAAQFGSPPKLGSGLSETERWADDLPTLYGAATGFSGDGPGGPSNLYAIDPWTGAATLIGPIGFDSVTGLAFLGDRRLVGSARGDDMFGGTVTAILIEIDPATGAGTLIGVISDIFTGCGRMPDITYDQDTDTLYGYGDYCGGAPEGLFTIDPVTGAGTSVGASGYDGGGNGMAIDLDTGTIYATPFDNASLITIDPLTGLGTEVPGSAGNVPTRVNALAFQPTSGVLYGSWNDPVEPNKLVIISTYDGTTITVGPTILGLDALIFAAPGYLEGLVYDADTMAPIAGADVEAANGLTFDTVSGNDGIYTMTVFADTYTVTGSAFGYLPTSIPSVTVVVSATTVQDIALTLAPTYVVDGYVTDSTTGWPLYASVDTNSPAGVAWTDPETGYYSIILPDGMPFDFHVEAWVPGYIPEDRVVGPISGDTTENFALDADPVACTAPGYQKTYGFFDDFESGYGNWIGTGLWNEESELNTCGSLVAPFPSSSHAVYYGQDGICTFDTGAANSGSLTLVSPVTLPDSGGSLQFASFEETECGGDCGYDNRYVEISNDGGATWDPLGEGDTEGTWYSKGFDLSAYGGDDVLIRFRFDTLDSIGNDYFGWMVDDVGVATGCVPQAGGLVVGNVYHENTLDPLVSAKVENDSGEETFAMPTPDDPNVDDAFYTLFSPPGDHLFTASFVPPYGSDDETVAVVDGDTVGQDFYLPAPHLVLDPEELEAWLITGTLVYTHVTGLDLINDGGIPLDFELVEISGTTTLLLGESQVTVAAAPVEAPARTAVTPEGSSSPDALFQPGGPRINLQSILHIATTDTSQSVERALNELGYAYDYIFESTDWTGIDFSPYDIVIVGMDGGGLTVASIAKVRTDVIDQGKRLIFMGGTCWYDFADGVNQYLVLNDTGDYCWTVSNTPHFTVVDPGHPLAQGLPPSYDFTNPSAAYYQMRAMDPDLEVVAVNGDGYDDLFYKNMNFPLSGGSRALGGDLIWFINSVYTSYWTNQADFDVLKQIVSNSITYSGGGDVPWFWEDPITGTVPAETTQNVAIGFTALYTDMVTPMPLGTYTATLLVHSNDPVSKTQHVPVTMHIVEEFINPTVSFESNAPLCFGETAVFTNTSVEGLPSTEYYVWDFGDGTTMTTTTAEPVTHTYAADVYTVMLTAHQAQTGVEVVYTDSFEVKPLPVADFTYTVSGLTLDFTNASANATNYEWDFGDGYNSTLENPSHTYAALGDYLVTLTVYGECGVDQIEMTVTATYYHIYLPIVIRE